MRRVAVSPIEVSVEEVGQDGDLPAGALGGEEEYELGTPAESDAEQGVFELGDDQEVRDAVASGDLHAEHEEVPMRMGQIVPSDM